MAASIKKTTAKRTKNAAKASKAEAGVKVKSVEEASKAANKDVAKKAGAKKSGNKASKAADKLAKQPHKKTGKNTDKKHADKKSDKKSGSKKGDGAKSSSGRLWDKGGSTNKFALEFTVGNDHILDTDLIPFDLLGTFAHVVGLEHAGVLTKDEVNPIVDAINKLLELSVEGKLEVSMDQEDSHTFIEQELVKRLGPLGLKVHTGRSRNDQAVTMLRLAMRAWTEQLAAEYVRLATSLLRLSERYPDAPMPGYTHMQRAMPSSVGAWALGYADVLTERCDALIDLRFQLNRNPLGSGAGYGVPLALKRHITAELVGFTRTQSVTAVQLTRGLDELAFCQATHTIGIVMSRMAADLVLFSTQEFGFCKLQADLTTGSSIMPQKANPDILELIRAKGAELAAAPAAISAILSGMPGGYQRDLQITKRHVVESMESCSALAQAATLAIEGLHFDVAACKRAMSPELYATAAAYRMVRDGVPFREAYKKAASDPKLWIAGFSEEGAEVADSPAYTAKLRDDLGERLSELLDTIESLRPESD